MLTRLHEAIAAVCPIDGVSGSPGNIRIDFRPEATGPQQADAQNVVASFDWSDAAHTAWLDAQETTLKDLKDQAQTGLDQITAENAQLDTFLAISNPTNAQNAAALKQLAAAHRASNLRQARIIQALVRVIQRVWR